MFDIFLSFPYNLVEKKNETKKYKKIKIQKIMVNIQSQMAHQEQELNNENYLEKWRSHKSSRNTSIRETPWERNRAYINLIDNDLDIVR